MIFTPVTSAISICLYVSSVDTAFQTVEHDLMDKILHGYNTNIRPVLNVNDPVIILLDLSLVQIVDFQWRDEHLIWNGTEYGNLSLIHINPINLWEPDVTLYNEVGLDEKTSKIPKLSFEINSSGRVRKGEPVTSTVSCNLDVTYFPWDVQTCFLQYGSWMMDIKSLDLHQYADKIDLANYKEHGEWEITNITIHREEIYYSISNYSIPSIYYTFHLKRRHLYYVYNLILPYILITVTALLTFCLPPDSGEKISLSVTVLLASTVFLLVVNESMPVQSMVVPYIAIYFLSLMVLLVLSLCSTVLVLAVHHRGNHGNMPPQCLRTLILPCLCRPQKAGDTEEENSQRCKKPERRTIGSEEEPNIYPKLVAMAGASVINSGFAYFNSISRHLETLVRYKEKKKERDEIFSEWAMQATALDRLFCVLFSLLTICCSLVFLLFRPN